ncbi:hypothetical protein [Candidatus Leptofilum sp.]|uniref:hypothetical protein n=1 Tax=Candidatus Leptofilum sp. TaxID=3241576 RepID=UPI003B5A7311
MSTVITDLEQVSVEWLTAVLTQSGALDQGQVATVESDGGAGNWSQNARLTLSYSDNAQGERPTRLFLKMVNTDLGDGEFFLPSEVTYYMRDYVDLPDAPLVRCYDGAYDATQHRYHLLLADMSETHEAAYGLKPNLAHGQAYAEATAILHAHWWGEARLRQIGASFHDAIHLKEFVIAGEDGIAHAYETFGEKYKPHWAALIHRIFAKLPARLASRAQDLTDFTLIHGDPNEGNILVPKVGEQPALSASKGPLYLIDQQPFDWSLTTWLGAYDLAYLIALHWDIDRRRELEMPVLRHYHKTLIERGVSGYSWEQLYEDYRLCVALTVPVAVEYMCDGGDPDWNWFRWGMIQHTLTAFDDLECKNLL